MKIRKLTVAEMVPGRLAHVSDRELAAVNLRLHQLFGGNFAGNDRMVAGDLNREDLVNAAIFVWAEMKRRGMSVADNGPLYEEAERLRETAKESPVAETTAAPVPPSPYAPILPGSDGALPPVGFDSVLPAFERAIVLREPAVSVVGSLCTRGESRNDIDILIHGPFDDATRRVIQFRLGRALPAELSRRVHFHDEALGGPITAHAHLYDLVLVPRADRATVVAMGETLEKQDDPHQDWPAEPGKRPAVVQIHCRGRSAHFDFRVQPADYLVGWTLFAEQPGVSPDIETTTQARALYRGWSAAEGNRYLKPILAPNRQQGTKKARQPLDWLRIEGEVFGEGNVGATANERGVIVAVARPRVEWGIQLPYYHEYFLTGDPQWQGPLYFRALLGQGGTPDEETTGRRAPAGEVFWVATLSKEALPYVLSRRAVAQERMPPLGHSAMPGSLMAATPREFRFWEETTDASARKMRDDLVASRWFTDTNVAVVDGEFRRIVTKRWVWLPDPEPNSTPRPVTAARTDKAVPQEGRFALSWLYWRGPMIVRTGPSRSVWLLMLDAEKGLEGWEFQSDPLAGGPVGGIARKFSGKGLLAADQKLEPGESIDGNVLNDTKATPAWIRQQDHGTFRVLEEHPGYRKVQFRGDRLRGDFILQSEEADSAFWIMERSAKPGGARKVEGENPDAPRRVDLRPGDHFRPMKPAGGVGISEFRDVPGAVKDWATPAVLRLGVAVEPKWNGFRAIASRTAEGLVRIWFEDSQEDRSKILPGLTAELAKIPGEWILDGELLDFDSSGSARPRATLGRFNGDEPQDDSGVRLTPFRVLYWDRKGGNLTQEDEEAAAKTLAEFWDLAAAAQHLRHTPRRVVHLVSDLTRAVAWARAQEGSEGAMLKRLDATYSLGGESHSWVKLKHVRRVNALVLSRDPVVGSPGVWNYQCAVGPLSEDNGFDPEETAEFGGKRWAIIGVTGNSAIDAKPGDIIQVSFNELQIDAKPGERRVRWFGPAVVDLLRDDLSSPSSLADTERMARDNEVRKLLAACNVKTVEVVKTEEERYVLGIVLEPNDGKDGAPFEPDAQKDIYSKAEVRQAAHRFMEQFRNIGMMHRTLINGMVHIIESFVVPDGDGLSLAEGGSRRVIRPGTWLLGLRIADDALWTKIKRDEFTGLSIGGSARRVDASGSPVPATS